VLAGRAVDRLDRSAARHPRACSPRRATAGRAVAIEYLNEAAAGATPMGETREFTVKGWGGEAVQVFVTYPPGLRPARSGRSLHSIHGGPHAAHP